MVLPTLHCDILCVFPPHEGAVQGVSLVLRPRFIAGLPAVQVYPTGKTGHAICLVGHRVRLHCVASEVEEPSSSHGMGHCPAT